MDERQSRRLARPLSEVGRFAIARLQLQHSDFTRPRAC